MNGCQAARELLPQRTKRYTLFEYVTHSKSTPCSGCTWQSRLTDSSSRLYGSIVNLELLWVSTSRTVQDKGPAWEGEQTEVSERCPGPRNRVTVTHTCKEFSMEEICCEPT